jgi:hypothetical protein
MTPEPSGTRLSEMRTLGDVIMVAAALGLVAVAIAAGYSLYDRPVREFSTPVEWPLRRSPYLRFFDEHSAWTVLLPLFLILGVGWVVRHYG